MTNTMKVYTLEEACEVLGGVSNRTLYRYIKSGKIKANKVGKRWLITEENLRKCINGETD